MKAHYYAAVAAAFLTGPALAHHSGAMFDATKSITKEGTVKEFQWTNPHTWLNMMVMNEQGQPEEWAMEFGSLNTLAHNGWKPTSLKPGDKVTVTFRPMRNGSKAGLATKIVMPDGTEKATGGGANGAGAD